jgi:hypothetical protein
MQFILKYVSSWSIKLNDISLIVTVNGTWRFSSYCGCIGSLRHSAETHRLKLYPWIWTQYAPSEPTRLCVTCAEWNLHYHKNLSHVEYNYHNFGHCPSSCLLGGGGYFTTDGQSVSLGVVSTLELVTKYYFLSERCCLKFAVLFLCDALSDERTDLLFAVQSLNRPSRSEPITILYCLIWDFPNLEGQVPVFITPRNWVAQLYPRALDSLYVVSYDSQGYGWGILTLPYIYILQEQDSPVQSQSQNSKSRYDQPSVNQYVLVSSPLGIKRVSSERISIRHQEEYIKAKFFYVTIWRAACGACSRYNVEFGYHI